MFEKFLELQVDDFKGRELRHALEQHVYKQTSFPSLTPEDEKLTASPGSLSSSQPKQAKVLAARQACCTQTETQDEYLHSSQRGCLKESSLVSWRHRLCNMNFRKKVKPKLPVRPPPGVPRVARQADIVRPIADTPSTPMESDTFVIGGEVPRPLPPLTRHPRHLGVQRHDAAQQKKEERARKRTRAR